MVTVAILLATILVDLAVGMVAYKLSKSNQAVIASNTETNASLVALLSKQQTQIDNHEYRIVILERKAA